MRTPATVMAAIGVLLSGCGIVGEAADEATEQGAESVAEAAAEGNGGADANADLDLDDGEVNVSSDDGSFTLGQDVPDDFPREIPLIDGEVASASKVDNADALGWVVQITVADPEAAYEQALGDLTAAGFAPPEGTPEISGGAVTTSILVDQDWQVVLATLGDVGVISYTVTDLDH